MIILKCKMCGGNLNYSNDETVVECPYCGTNQTIPLADNERKIKLYERANKLRFDCEFDKAAGVYESIISEYVHEAEAYWGVVLCRYGIEYVDDAHTGKKVPTCHRSSYNSIMEDSDFDMVMENADGIARSIYRDEAKRIEEIRKGIIEVSNKEEPYDVFICYKETSADGERTIDSVIAQDIYDILTNAGYRVFFSRITLEDKLGIEYEPYIFSALNSAKLMLVVGTSYDNFNAVWVKNEWKRFIELMTKDKNKYLIPCFKDVDAYDIPREFSKLQSQDMSKIGAMQDLLHGIKKLLNRDNIKTSLVQEDSMEESMLKRGYLALEDSEWEAANSFFEKALDYNPESARAYMGKYLSQYKYTSMDSWKCDICTYEEPMGSTKETVGEEDVAFIENVIEQFKMDYYLSEETIRELFSFDWKIAFNKEEWMSAVEEKKLNIENDNNLIKMVRFFDEKHDSECTNTYKEVLSILSNVIYDMPVYFERAIQKKRNEYIQFCNQTESKVRDLYEIAKKQRDDDYIKACKYQENDNTSEAQELLEKIGDYKDSLVRLQSVIEINVRIEPLYSEAIKLGNSNVYDNVNRAIEMLESIREYKNAEGLIKDYKEKIERLRELENIRKDYLQEYEKKKIKEQQQEDEMKKHEESEQEKLDKDREKNGFSSFVKNYFIFVFFIVLFVIFGIAWIISMTLFGNGEDYEQSRRIDTVVEGVVINL